MEKRNSYRRSVLGDRGFSRESKSMDKEEVVMTASRPNDRQKNDCKMIRLERKCQSEIDFSQIHFIGGGPYKGILVNKLAEDLAEVEPAEGRLEFLVYLSDNERENKSIMDYWTLRFWFLGRADGVTKKRAFTDYFQELMNQDDFPKNYIGFVKRALVLLKKYSLIKRVELLVENNPEDSDEADTPIRSFITVITPDAYNYQLVPEVPVNNKTFLTFQIKAAGDAHIALSAMYSELQFKTHEIVIGENNKRSVIRDGSLGQIRAESMTMNILSDREFRYFWISWLDHHIEVGRGQRQGQSRFLHWRVPPNKQFNINCLAVSTGKASKGRWEFVELLEQKVVDFSRAARKARLKSSLIWLSKKMKMIQFLEDTYPNSASTQDLLTNCKVKCADTITAVVMLNELQKRGLIKELEKGIWLRLPNSQHSNSDMKMVKDLPFLAQQDHPTIAIISSLYSEKLAVDAMIEEKSTYFKNKTDGESQVYTIGKIGKHIVVSTKLSKGVSRQKAMISSENTITRLLGVFSFVEHVILVGVGGAVPHFSDFSRHVRLGDVVVSTPLDKSGSLYVHCQNVEKMPRSPGYSYVTKSWSSANHSLQNAVQKLKRAVDSNPNITKPWDFYFEEGRELLEDEESDFNRPSIMRDKLFATQPNGTVVQYEHPKPSGSQYDSYTEAQVTIRYGVIGSGRLITRNEEMRKEFAKLNGIKCFDLEFDSVLDSLDGSRNRSFIIIRGMADYVDGTEKKGWQPYAALVAAAYMKSLLYVL
ncbi:uncharacterized protein LOC115230770 [Argonauta hians]